MKLISITNTLRFLACIAFLGTVQVTYGQSTNEMADLPVEEKAAMITAKQTEELQLTEAQSEKMEEINLRYMKEMEEIAKEGRSLSTANKLKKMRKKKDNEVREFLSEEQFKGYEEMSEKMREEMKAQMKSKEE